MKRLHNLKIGNQLMLLMTTLIIAVIGTACLLTGIEVRKTVAQDAQELIKETASHYAAVIQADLAVALEEVRALANFLEAMRRESTLSHQEANLILKYFTEQHPKLLGTYLMFEPNIFKEDTARFLAYWNKQVKEEMVLKAALNTYYPLAKQHKQETVIKPYAYLSHGQKVLVTSLVVPILNPQQEFLGIAGVDLTLANIQEKIKQMIVTQFKNGFINFYATDGIIIASPDSSTVGEVEENQKLLDYLRKNETFILKTFSKTLGKTVLTYGVPLKIGPWMVTLNVPEAEVSSQSSRMMLIMTLIVILAIMIAMGLVYLFSKNLSKPLSHLVKVSKSIAAGNFNNEITWHGRDEIGQLLQSFDQMQKQLHRRTLEEQRITNETSRINQALNQVNTSVLIVDNHYQIIYVNQSAQWLFKERQAAIREQLPDFEVNRLLGSSLDQFHPNPGQQYEMLEQLTTTHHFVLNLGGVSFEVKINPVIDVHGERLGWVAEFADRTVEVTTEQEINRVMLAAAQGDFKQRIYLENKTGFFKTFSQHLNQTFEYTQQMIEELRHVFAAVADGDLSQVITQNYAGSLELLKNDVNTTVTTLTRIMSTVKQSAEIVSKAAEEISQGNLSLNQRTQEQAASLEETAASMQEMTSIVQRNSDHAQEAKVIAETAKNYAVQGGAAVNSVVEAMQTINRSSKKMSEILGVINDIAFQTNLLALNAAVEAARAGEQGRGFAVVAAEVRNLAQRSAEAAKEIKSLIEDSIDEVEDGTWLASQSGKTLQEVMEAVKKVSDIIADIAAASLEQTLGIQQVNQAIYQLDEVIERNAALVEEAASASEILREQAHTLKNQVEFFKIQNFTSTLKETRHSSKLPKKEIVKKRSVPLSSEKWGSF